MPTIVDVVLEAQPDSLGVMRQRVQALASKEDPKINGAPSFVRLQKIPQLHFMSMQIFEDGHFDPLLVFENNFDGTPDTYWPDVLAQLSDDLRSIFACTKQAKLDPWSQLFLAGNTDSLLPFLKAHSCGPSASHFGAVANSLPRITRDRGVFEDLQSMLGAAPFKNPELDAAGVQSSLRNWACNKYDWLGRPETPTTEKALSNYKWSTVRSVLPQLALLVLFVCCLTVLVVALLLHASKILPWHGFPGLRPMGYLLLLLVCVTIVILGPLFIVLSKLYKALRRLENTDFIQNDPQLSLEQMKLFAAQEDEIVQNHLASMVLVKPGMIRGFLIRTALRLLKFGVPIVASNGYLGSMRTIHFAHWTLVGNSGRLLFLSNFDGSWQSYLDDFVDKAAHGLTLAWGNCIGFPRTKNLILEGAAYGTQFKAWARQSQTQSILWYSAYKTLTVNQILRNAAIVDGLRKVSMQPGEAEEWAQLL